MKTCEWAALLVRVVLIEADYRNGKSEECTLASNDIQYKLDMPKKVRATILQAESFVNIYRRVMLFTQTKETGLKYLKW